MNHKKLDGAQRHTYYVIARKFVKQITEAIQKKDDGCGLLANVYTSV